MMMIDDDDDHAHDDATKIKNEGMLGELRVYVNDVDKKAQRTVFVVSVGGGELGRGAQPFKIRRSWRQPRTWTRT